MTKKSALIFLGSFFAGIGYISCLMQWLWVAIVGLPPLIKSGVLDEFMQPQQVEPSRLIVSNTDLSPISLLAIGILTLIFLIVTVVIFIRLPKTISKTGQKALAQATEAIVPVITHHKPLPQKKKRELSRNITLLLQLLLVATAFVASLVLPEIKELTHQVITTVAAMLMVISLVSFITSRLLPVKTSTSRTRSHASHG